MCSSDLEALANWGAVPEDSEYHQYWKERKSKCKIVKVTTIIEDVDEMEGVTELKDLSDHRNSKHNSVVLKNVIAEITDIKNH